MRRKRSRNPDTKLAWLLYRHLRKIWVRVAGFALFALISAAASQFLGRLMPTEWAVQLGADAVDQVLNILATTLLAVTTFSLSVSVSAFASAAGSATPRATALLQEDHTTQNVLATFLGAFLFSLVGIVALNAGYYTDNGRLVLFAATILVIALVVIALIRWISHIINFGRMNDTLDRVERAAAEAISQRLEAPWLGGKPLQVPPPADALTVPSRKIGYVQHIDMEALSEVAKKHDLELWIEALPGSFVHPASNLLSAAGGSVEDVETRNLGAAFTIDRNRDFSQDPGFGLIVMAEIASRALSPAVNDPGTAVDVLGRLTRILAPWRSNPKAPVNYPLINVPSVRAEDLLDVAFRPIARDGANMFEVQWRLQQALTALSQIDPVTFHDCAMRWSEYALWHARAGQLCDGELADLVKAALAK